MDARSTEDYEVVVGSQVRRLRIDADLTQAQVADRAGLSPLTVHHLENGKGSTLRTLILVLRVLGQTDWLDQLAPDSGPSPLDLLRESRGKAARLRVRHSDGGGA